jgi:hypothetical protein
MEDLKRQCFLFGPPKSYGRKIGSDSELKSKLSYYRWPVGQSVLVSGHHPRPATNFSFTFKENIFRHLQCSSGVPSQTRGWVCNFSVQYRTLSVLSLLGPTSAGLVIISDCLI